MRRPSSRTRSPSGETSMPRVAVSPFTDTLPAETRSSALRREGAAPARARKAWRRISMGLLGLGLARRRGEALAHTGELLFGDERVEGWEVLAGGCSGGEEELLGQVDEGGGAGAGAVGADLGEEVA